MRIRLTLFQKGVILAVLPFVVQIGILALLLEGGVRQAEVQRLSLHSKEVRAEAQHLLTLLGEVLLAQRGFVLTGSPEFITSYESAVRDLDAGLERLNTLTADNPPQQTTVGLIAEKGQALRDWQGEVIRRARTGDREGAIAQVKTLRGKRQLDELRQLVGVFLTEEERLEAERQQVLTATQRRLGGILMGGTAVSFLGMALLAVGFAWSIGSRLSVLAENARRLARREQLVPPVGGADEVTVADRAFHELAFALARSEAAQQTALEEARDLYNNAPCGYHSLDAEGTFVAINDTELRWLGYRREEVVGQLKFPDLLTPASREAFAIIFPLFKELGWASGLEFQLARRDGTVFTVLLSATALRDAAGNHVASRTTLFDITERKKAENEVRRLNEELEARVHARTAELEEVNRDLAEKNRENEMFVYSVSHDLRSPLVNLEGFSRELTLSCNDLRGLLAESNVPVAVRRRGLAVLEGDIAESVRFIQTAVRRLSTIIDALLRLSRAGRVEYARALVDLGAIVSRVVDSLQATAVQRDATVTWEELPPAWGDAAALEQVFANLVSNALKYLAPGRPGRVEIGWHKVGDSAGDFLTYYVKDNGLGVPEAYQHKIFQAFQRVHPDVADGEGMGLTIVRRIVERHRGRVWVESTSGAGSTFFVTLPRPEPAGG